jgi:uncharacterized protein involved in type VI secretion and phage assembly
MNGQGPPFYGKFRGVVTDNRDPKALGRIRAKVPDVLGDNQSGWAMPAVPYAGDGVGLHLLPPVDALVWVEFEHGDADYPVWTGGFWAQGQIPVDPAAPERKVLKSEAATLTLDDTPGTSSVTIETTSGMKITIDTNGIEIDDGQGGSVKLSGPRVSVNDGALEVS